MKLKPHHILIFALIMGLLSSMACKAQGRQIRETDNYVPKSIAWYYFKKPDTIKCYFNEILSVENGKLITQWVNGFKVVKKDSDYFKYLHPGAEYFYQDKTKVTNKIIQSY